jgi:hypothetical protein
MTDREYVERVWDRVIELRSIFSTHSMGIRIYIPLTLRKYQKVYFQSWSEAADFTRSCLKELQKLDKEIQWTESRSKDDDETYERLIERLEDIRTNLTRGIRKEYLDDLKHNG